MVKDTQPVREEYLLEGYWNIHQVDQKRGEGGWKPSESLSVAEKHSQDQATGEMALGDTLDFAALSLYSSLSLTSLCCLGRE